MLIELHGIPMREVLHYLGWRGTEIEEGLLEQIKGSIEKAHRIIRPRAVLRRFSIEEDGVFGGTAFLPKGRDVQSLLASCHEAYLLAATLGVESERLLLMEQARSSTQAVIMDAVLSAAIEAVCDQMEDKLRGEFAQKGLHLTDRFSPGYGDMPLEQTRDICEVLSAARGIGLTVSSSGIMIPRKSVTAVLGVSRTAVDRRPSGCAACPSRSTCALAGREQD